MELMAYLAGIAPSAVGRRLDLILGRQATPREVGASHASERLHACANLLLAQTSQTALPHCLHLAPVLPTPHTRLGAPLPQVHASPRRRHAAATTR